MCNGKIFLVMRRAVPNRLLSNEIINQIRELFTAQLKHPVELLFFTSEVECETCEEINQLLKEITELSDKVHLQNYDIENNAIIAQKYNIQYTPGLVVAGLMEDNSVIDYGIRIIGAPSGYEFSSLLQAIILVSRRDSGLKTTTREKLNHLKDHVHLQVFVTPT